MVVFVCGLDRKPAGGQLVVAIQIEKGSALWNRR